MRYITIALLLFATIVGNAQEGKIERGTKNFNKYDFVDAQEIYQKVADKGYESADLFKRLGDSYYLNASYKKSSTYYGKLIEQFPEAAQAEAYFRYALSLRATKDYALSDRMMSRFFDLKEDDRRASLFKETPDYLREIDYQKGSYEVSNTTINSGYSDFGPMLYNDKLIFASNRDTGSFTKRIHKWNGQPFLNLYQVSLNKVDQDAGNKYVEKFSAYLNTQYHESTPVFTEDGKTVYFTRNNYNNGKYREDNDGTNRLKLYKASLVNGKWTDSQELPFNSDEYTVAHPALSVDGSRLYFASDMPGTFGLSDLWYVSINGDKTYGTPVNLGSDINTEGRESFPFISSENDIYFASDGHPGLGGLDLFVTALGRNGETAEILNLGEPANTSKDDFAFVINSESNTGFLSSNRGKRGVDDNIYMLKQIKKPSPPCDILLSGIVTDKSTGDYLEGATVSLYDTNNNLFKSVVTGASAAFAFIPDCDKIFLIRAEKEGYNTSEKMVTTPNVSSEIEEILQLDKTLKPVVPGDDIAKILDLNPIYFNFDKYDIRPDAEVELAKVLVYMETYPSVRIDVRSHTDSRGRDAYNLNLSQNRNVSTRDWLISKGISASRLTGKGYGETQLVNDCGNGVRCSKDQHQLNRRSEFIVLSN
ncbi:outer membrane protein OmpA-like peptidoglycan-associated protein [Dokdonia sp. Hel_I_63]|uniref:OmpA family protein n=1 Tax=Dokdonia sp. Hel_I_63 TaxID=1249996 RepID=UPI00119B8C7C|nr:OmpA family protein [Dokdonia sp. Hel_I_63]TVZ22676.1 outer membrane protein OmpA-like peptidoglycan-associated protein [Dokdonia sp. Hel_I_63]